jgi:hypothetical protein
MELVIAGFKRELEEPNICPHCHVVNNPKLETYKQSSGDVDDPIVISLWRCANKDCDKIMVVESSVEGQESPFVRFLNGLPKGPNWPKPIADLKNGNDINQDETTRFIKTYLQSLAAEHNGLDEIAGMGYRKSIEYLVKDWAIQNNPQDKDKIEAFWLGQVITNYYTGDLKDILERATWLGNDQSHYNKLFEEYDIQDLKELIDLIMVELDRQHKMKHYIDTIQKRK